MRTFLHTLIGLTLALFCCIQTAKGQATLVTNPPDGHYCQGATPAGVQILIENSNPGTTYFLRRQGQPAIIAQVTGTGGTVAFSGYYVAGATPWVYITVPQTNPVTVTRNPQPIWWGITISDNGHYCTYPGAQGVEIGISGSTPGVEYRLFLGADLVVLVSGTGSPMSFGFFTTEGIYYVIAEILATGCATNLGSVEVTHSEPPTAAFTATQNQCANTPVQFTDQSVANHPGAEIVAWLWNFDDPNSGTKNTSTLQNPSHTFEAWGNDFQTFNVSLTVTDSYGCENETIMQVTVQQKPDATLNATGCCITKKVENDTVTFAYCGDELTVLFTFHNQSTTTASNTWYHIDWGDGSAPFSSATFDDPITHLYSGAGYKTLTYTINGANGCNHIKKYYIFIGSTPSGGLLWPGFTVGNAPFDVSFDIQDATYDNPPGTRYVMDWGDGSPLHILYQEELNLMTAFEHTYTSCYQSLRWCTDPNNPDDYFYAFRANLQMKNPCFTVNSVACPIIVSCPAAPNFRDSKCEWSWGGLDCWGSGPEEIMACNPVTFSNETQPGFYITGNGTSFTIDTYYEWDFGDPASGSSNFSNEENPTHIFSQSCQSYTVTLSAYTGMDINNNSGIMTISKEVFIQENPIADFEMDDFGNNCVPKQVQMINTSDIGCFGVPNWEWTVDPPNGWQIITPGFEGDNTVENPLFQFNVSGTYHITLTIENSCGTDEITKTVLVCQEPELAFDYEEYWYCGPGPRDFATVNVPTFLENCTPPITYLWEVTGPAPVGFVSPTTSISKYPIINFPDFGVYEITLTITNECATEFTTQTVHVTNTLDNNTISTATPEVCEGFAPILIEGTLPAGGTGSFTYIWERYTLTNPIWTQVPMAIGQNLELSNPLSETTWFRRWAYDSGDCSSVSNAIEITLYPAIENNLIIDDQIICQGVVPEMLIGTIPSGAFGEFSYQWQMATDSNPYFVDIAMAFHQNFQPLPIIEKTYFRRLVNSLICPTNISNVVTIETIPMPNANAGPDQHIIFGMTTTLNGTVSGGTPPYTSYSWTPADKIASGGNTLIATTVNLDATTTFILTVIDSNGCIGTDNITVFVEGDPLSVTIDPASVQICPGTTVDICAFPAGGTGNYQFSWNSSPPGLFSDLQCINVTHGTSITYTVVVFDGYSTASAFVVVEVLPVPVVNSLLNITICSNTQLNYEPTSTIPGSTFQWITTPGGSCTGNSSGQGTIIEDLLINNGPDDCVITYEITPFGPTPPYCSGETVTLNVTVKSVPYVTNTISQQTVISGQLTEPVTFTANLPEAGFQWEVFNTNCEDFLDYPFPNGTTATIPSQIITILAGGPSQCYLTYRVTPYLNIPGNTCPGVHFYYTFIINLEPQSFNMICPPPICSGQSATISLDGSELGVEYLLLRNGSISVPPAKPGTGNQLDWENMTIAGSYSIRATNLSNGQTSMMNGVCQFVVNPLPEIYQLSAMDNEHCAPVTPLLSGSELYVNYELILDGTSIVQIVPGTGNAGLLAFTPVTDPGVYTVRAYNPFTGCFRFMTGSISVDPSPLEFPIYPGGILCQGSTICIEASEIGVIYQLWKNEVPYGVSLAGTGAALCFGELTEPGNYLIYAGNPASGCAVFFSQSILIEENPMAFDVLPELCCPGCEIHLSGSQLGIEYQLFRDNLMLIQAIGTGSAISFGAMWEQDEYSVKAMNPQTGCATWMNGSTTILPGPDPTLTDPYNQWTNCNPFNAIYTLIVVNESSTAASNVAYTIDWGDGSPLFTAGNDFVGTSHTYTTRGLFNLLFSVEGENGCISEAVYPVFNGKNPTGNFSAGLISGCAPFDIVFTLSGNAATNTTGTMYHLDFGDGITLTLSQNDLPTPNAQGNFEFVHTYAGSSCGLPGNAFTFTGTIENPCNTKTNMLYGIQVSAAAFADFERTSYPNDPIVVFANTPHVFENNSQEGCLIVGGNAIIQTSYYWDFYNNGIIDSEEENPVFTFETPGVFQVKLTAFTAEGFPENCGPDVMIREVFVDDPILISGLPEEIELSCVNFDFENDEWLPMLLTPEASNYGAAVWTTTGDGLFESPTSLQTQYLFGEHDFWAGQVILTLEVFSQNHPTLSVTHDLVINLPTQVIEFEVPGWYGLSSYVDLSELNIEEVLQPVNGNFDIVVNRDGAIYAPNLGLNQIGNWEAAGYQINITSPCCLHVYGDSINTRMYDFAGSYDYLPVLNDKHLYVDQLFESQLEKIAQIYSWNESLVWTPQMHHFNLLKPGRAYLIELKPEYEGMELDFPPYNTSVHRTSQQLDLNQGWNSASLFVDPYNSELETMLAPLNPALIIMNDLTNGIFWPGQGINTIEGWNYTTAYTLKLYNAHYMDIPGVLIDFIPAMLDQGWNYMPVHSACEVSATDIFSPMAGQITIVKELIGTKVWWPEQNVYSLQTLIPGKGYEVKVNSPVQIDFPACTKAGTYFPKTRNNFIESHWGIIRHTPSSHIVAIPEGIIRQFEAGDILGAFDQSGNCYGAITISTVEPEALVIFGNDPLTVEKDGFESGEPIELRLFNQSNQAETVLVVSWNTGLPNNDGLFTDQGLSAIADANSLSVENMELTGMPALRIFPNPAGSHFNVRVTDSFAVKSAKINIYNMQGNMVKNPDAEPANLITVSIAELPKGIYTIEINLNQTYVGYYKLVKL